MILGRPICWNDQRSNVIDGPTVMNRLQIETNDIYVNFVVIGQLQRFEMAI